jgi:tetratricopeptide (TPR) repeat protein
MKIKHNSIWINLAKAYKRMNMYDKAHEILKYYLSVFPDNLIILSELGEVYMYKGDYRNAITTFKKILELDPNYEKIWKDLYKAYVKAGEYIKASKIKNHRFIVHLHLFNEINNLGLLYRKLLHNNTISDSLNSGSYKRFINLKFWKNMGNMCLEKDQFIKAIKYFKRALKVDPKHKNSWNKLGIAYKMIGEFNKAIESFKKAIKLDYKYQKAWSNLYLTYKSKNQEMIYEK